MRKSSLLFAILVIFLLTASAHAHDWYDAACCSGHDCHPVACESLVEKGKSIFYKSYEFFGAGIRPSQDGLCHVCIGNEDSKNYSPIPHCVYIQQGS